MLKRIFGGSPIGIALSVAGVVLAVSPEARRATRRLLVKGTAAMMGAVDQVKHMAVDATEGTMNAAGNVAGAATNTMGNMAGAAAGTMGAAVGTTTNMVGNALAGTVHLAGDAMEGTMNMAAQVVESVGDVADLGTEMAAGMMHTVADRMDGVEDAIREQLH